jgi:hypothetical protein
MPRALAPFTLMLTSLLVLSGCCGGYAVVRTTVLDHAELRPGPAGEVQHGGAYVLHYSRLGEPPNDCGSEVKYLEDLRIRVPSLRVGETFLLGTEGVTASYSRQQGETTVSSRSISGTLTINEQTGESVAVALAITITLQTGEVVSLDDEYAFHPSRNEQTSQTSRAVGICRF